MPSVIDYSHNLTSAERNVRGLDIIAMKKNENINFQVTKHNFGIFKIEGYEDNDSIVLEKTHKDSEKLSTLDIQKLSKNLNKTIKEYAKENRLKIKINF
jgi:S-adenosylmethionine synthetase